MRFELGPTPEVIRVAQEERLDREAGALSEGVRDPRLARMDEARLKEARSFLQDGGAGDYPMLATIPGDLPTRDRANAIVQAASSVSTRLMAIEAARLAAKARLRACTCPVEMRRVTLEVVDVG